MTRYIATLVACIACTSAAADDWAQFRGPTRDGQSKESKLLQSWPAAGPALLWTAGGIGSGYSSAAIADGKVYVTGMSGGQGALTCFDTKGKQLWRTVYGAEYEGGGFRRGPGTKFAGARTTPTVHDGRVFLLSAKGVVTSHDAATGKNEWAVDVLKKFNGRNLKWGMSESLLVEDGKLIVTPGGTDASVVALDPETGKTIWRTKGLSHQSAYCSPMAVDHGKVRMILTMTGNAVVGIAPADGKVLWQHPYRNRRGIHPVTPIYYKGHVFATSGYGHGALVVKLNDAGSAATEVWREKILDNHHGGLVRIGAHVYGTSSSRPKAKWLCVEITTGKVRYEERGIGKGSVIAAGGKLYAYGEDGTVALAKASPDGFGLISSFRITVGEMEHWAHPAIADGVLYIRHGTKLQAYRVGASK